MTIVELDECAASQATSPDKPKETLLDISGDSYSVPNEDFHEACACIRTPSKTEGDLGADPVLWEDVRKYLKGNPSMVRSLKSIASGKTNDVVWKKSVCGLGASVMKSPCKAKRHNVPLESERNWAHCLLSAPTEEAQREIINGASLVDRTHEDCTTPPRKKSSNAFPMPRPGQVFSLDASSIAANIAATYIEQGSEVILQVYDLTSWTKASNLPIYHLGVQVYRLEYFFCARGIQSCIPMANKGHIFKESVSLGRTNLSLKDVRHLLQKLREYWCADSYRMLGHNCQTFALAFCEELGLMKSVPPEYSRFSDLGDLRAQMAGLVDGATSFMPRLSKGPTLLQSCSVSNLGRTNVCSTRPPLKQCVQRTSAMPCAKNADATVDGSPTTLLDLDKLDQWSEDVFTLPRLRPRTAP
jgi:hypothetical protein